MQQTITSDNFYGLGIAPGLLEVLEKLKFTTPTPIQRQAIPIGVEGKDVVGIAQTGTGKTLAFGIPMVQRLAQSKNRGLILVPTRELALQVDKVLHTIGKTLGLRTAVLIGGAAFRPQMQDLKNNPNVIIATPGRLNDHLQQKTVSLNAVNMLVIDEADRMLEMGFQEQIQKILKLLTHDKQTMLFSATLSPDVMKIASSTMKLPVQIEVAPQGTTSDIVAQEIFIVKNSSKSRLLEKILTEHHTSTLVFTRTKRGASKVMKSVRSMGHSAAEIHSNRTLGQRREALEGFKTGKYKILVATDIAARGIDVTGIELVVNYDLPSTAADYVHRIGRTGRAGAGGRAISFGMPDQQHDIRDIERFIRKTLPRIPLPELPPERPRVDDDQENEERRDGRRGQSRGGSNRRNDRGERKFVPRDRGTSSFKSNDDRGERKFVPRDRSASSFKSSDDRGERRFVHRNKSRTSFNSNDDRGNREKVSSERSPFRSDDRGNREQVNTDRNDSRGNREQKSGERKYENRNPRFAGGGRKFSSDTRGAVRGERKPFSDRTQRPQPQGDDRRHRKTQSGSSSGPSRNKFTTRIRSSAPRRDSTR